MLETVSTRISLGIEKRGHLQKKKFGIFRLQVADTQIGGCIKKIVIFSVTFQLGINWVSIGYNVSHSLKENS